MSDLQVDLLSLGIGVAMVAASFVLPEPFWKYLAISLGLGWLGSYFGVRALWWVGWWPGSPRGRQ